MRMIIMHWVRPMFTLVALRACVLVLKHFFCQIQCFDWAECSHFSAEA